MSHVAIVRRKGEPHTLDDPRWGDSRDRNDDSRNLSRGGRAPLDVRDRASDDPRDVFMRDLNLPRGPERERIHDRDRELLRRRWKRLDRQTDLEHRVRENSDRKRPRP